MGERVFIEHIIQSQIIISNNIYLFEYIFGATFAFASTQMTRIIFTLLYAQHVLQIVRYDYRSESSGRFALRSILHSSCR